MRLAPLSTQRIVINGARRPVDPAALAELKASMADIGLLNPITVWERNGWEAELVAGLHRLTAARDLGWTEIMCHILTGDEKDARAAMAARMAEISENLHRAELSTGQRDALIVDYVRMVEERETLRQVMHAAPPVAPTRKAHAGNQPKPAAKVARALGIDKSTVTRALARARKAERAEAGEAPRRAPPPVSTEPRDLLALRRAWANACAESRERFLAEVQPLPNQD